MLVYQRVPCHHGRLLQLRLQLLQAHRLAHADLGQLWAVHVLGRASKHPRKTWGFFDGTPDELTNYPLVNIQKTMERSTILNGKINYICLWPCSIAFCMFTRG